MHVFSPILEINNSLFCYSVKLSWNRTVSSGSTRVFNFPVFGPQKAFFPENANFSILCSNVLWCELITWYELITFRIYLKFKKRNRLATKNFKKNFTQMPFLEFCVLCDALRWTLRRTLIFQHYLIFFFFFRNRNINFL